MTSDAPGPRGETRTGTSAWAGRAGLVGVAGQVAFWVVSLTLGFLWAEYSPIHNFLSTLSAVGAPYAFAAQLNLYVWGGSIVVLALGLHAWSRRARPWVGVILLAGVGVGIILAGVFQHDPENLQGASTTGHRIATRVMMLSTLLGLPLTTWRLAREDRWSGYRRGWMAVGVAVLLVASLALNMIGAGTGPDGWAGLGQRIFFAVLSGWAAYHGVALYRRTRRGEASA